MDDADRFDGRVHLKPDPGSFEDAGLYDPSSPDAAGRLELLTDLVEHGLTIEEIAAADAQDALQLEAVDRLIKGGRERLTLAEGARRAQVPYDLALRIWLADGFPDPGDALIFTEHDWDFPLFQLAAEIMGEDVALQVTRVMGSAMARIAEAEAAAFAHSVAQPTLDDPGHRLDFARASVQLMQALPAIGHFLDRIHRHHLEAALRRIILATGGFIGSVDRAPMSVGFADITGYTALSQRLTHEELATAIGSFEAISHDVVIESGGRVVKHIGDEVMFAATDPAAACEIALTLVEKVRETSVLPPLRTGLAAGEVLLRDGDYYGPVINLAARAAATAPAGQIFVSDEVRELVDEDAYVFTTSGTHQLKGFDAPIELFALARRSP